jgi:transcriptional regulator with XRE-family HTH domain
MPTPTGEKVRGLREARSWTQQHLADAAGLSLRTVQRLEAMHSGSAETLLAVAAALDVDVRTLNGAAAAARRSSRLWRAPHPAAASAWAAVLLAPAALFVAVNLLKYGAGLAVPYDMLASLGSAIGAAPAFESASPVLFLGGPLLALALILFSQVRPEGEWEADGLTLTAVQLRFNRLGIAVALAACLTLAALGAYLAGETLHHLAIPIP